MEYPLVSVCIPARNSERTLSATLNSVLQQDYPHLEVIVSNNQSTDSTRDVILAYADRGIRYCMHSGPPDWAAGMPSYIGAYLNANFVLSQGHGEFLCLYHADDVYDSKIISKQVALMQANPQVGAVFTMLRAIGEDGQMLRMGCTRLPSELHGQQIFNFDKLFNAILRYNNFLATPTLMIRRVVFEAVGGFDEHQFFTSADLEMWLRIARYYKIGVIDEPLLNYRISLSQGGAQYNILRTTLADFLLVIDHFLAQPEVRQVAKSDALAFYEMERSADQVLCSMNLLVQGRVAEAQIMLKEALCWRHFVTASQRPRRLARMLIGVGLLISARLGLGSMAGQGLFAVYQQDLERRRQPASKVVH